MADGANANELLARTLDLYRRTGALVRDFGVLLNELVLGPTEGGGRGESFVSHVKGTGDIVAYSRGALSSANPDYWTLEAFAAPYRSTTRCESTGRASRLICLAVALHSRRHREPYLKVGVLSFSAERGRAPLTSSEGWCVYHSMAEGGYVGKLSFEAVDGSRHLVRSKPKARDYGTLVETLYFGLPLLEVASYDDLRDLCVRPVLRLWREDDPQKQVEAFKECVQDVLGGERLALAAHLPEMNE